MMGEWSRYNFFLPRIIMLSDLYILLIKLINRMKKIEDCEIKLDAHV